MSDIIDRVKQSTEFKQEAAKELSEFKKESVVGQAQAGAVLLVQNKALLKASQIMAEEIYDLTEENENLSIENNGLKSQLGTYLNEDQLKKYCHNEKLSLGTNSDRNKRILEKLNKRLAESDRQIKYSSTAAQVATQSEASQPVIAKKK